MDYEELTYIESDTENRWVGGSYINTDISATSVNGFEVKVETLELNVADFPFFVGSLMDDFVIGHNSETIDPCNKFARIGLRGEWIRNLIDNVITYHNGTLICGDVTCTIDTELCPTLGVEDYPIFLFSGYDGIRRNKCRIYYFRLFLNDTIVADMIPARRLSDNAIGMYDVVRGEFFDNSGSGTFIAGEPTGIYY